MLENFVILILGALLGIGSSLAAWWITARFFQPMIEFSSEISKRPSKSYKSGWLYRVKFKNSRKRRAIDVTVVVRVAIYELGLERTWNWFEIPTQVDAIPALGKNANRLVVMKPHISDRFQESIFPPEVRKMAKDGSLTPEDLLKLGKKSFLRVYVAAFDEFSGNRKLFLSPKYEIGDFRKGDFRHLNIVEYNRKIVSKPTSPSV